MPAPAPEPALGFLHGGSFSQLATLADPAVRLWRPREIYLPDATEADFAGLTTLIVSDRLHLGLLPRVTAWVNGVAERGGTVVVLGENGDCSWVPGLGALTPAEVNFWWWRLPDGDNGVRRAAEDHEAWAHLTPRAVRRHYHGLLTPPPGATVLAYTDHETAGDPATEQVLLYEDRVSTPGRLLVTTMDPVYHHGSRFMPGATQLLLGLLHWTGVKS
ncbi:hypothetical protein ACFWQ9_00245 [Streptomyces albidoflavus]|uniref:Uncharacterized protein n=1 Tax=Streptomyces albidoflavus TaxID=1886 RepID=A0AB37XLL3_9ACTN|nr:MULTISPECIES: hypothetical protein [Streptomyces]MYX85326.1 hypothetical protein [Streptomyces sp. SID4915]QLA55905.1 hypothetical protein HWN34_04650 [Streptomyces violascens]SCD63034.1 hypothetical protein GA0115236_114414 [Streptomyces sp. IgraMP-1]BDH49806.1 hypothetical protein MTP02_08170 [Streptomyces albus]AGI87194.1 Hypothetical protein XNR_0795 [Streptomyces albidoflavus]